MKILEKLLNFQQSFGNIKKENHIFSYRVLWLGVIGILLIVFGSVFDGTGFKAAEKENTLVEKEVGEQNTKLLATKADLSEEVLEAKLVKILSQVKGAGKVSVNIAFVNSEQQQYAKNKTNETKTVQEKDTAGGVRTTTESKDSEQILLSKEAGSDKPIVISKVYPEIKGVIVVAQGASNSTVKANLTKAIETGLGIASYKITVLPQ